MKVLKVNRLSAAMGAGMLATLASLVSVGSARAELVYESDLGTGEESPSQAARSEVRTDAREALGAAQRMQVNAETPDVVESAPAAVVSPESQAFSKSELMRRERQRAELKNEDVLQERLEELRLRDERRRVESLIGASAPENTKSIAPAATLPATLKEEIVTVPVTEGGRPNPAANQYGQSIGSSAPISTLAVSESGASENASISVMPRVGMSNMTGQNGFFDVRPRFATGVAAQFGASENFTLEVGYTYNEYGVAMGNSNPYVSYAMGAYGGQGNFETVAMKQNVIDLGLKAHLLGRDSKVRPFIGGGASYAKSFINFDSRYLAMMGPYGATSPDYDVSSYLGFLSTGADVKVAKNISVGAEFKYYAVFSARENNALSSYYGAMYYNPYAYGVANGVNPVAGSAPAAAGGTLARSSFYSILGNVTFTF
jgi:outer membrane protein W